MLSHYSCRRAVHNTLPPLNKELSSTRLLQVSNIFGISGKSGVLLTGVRFVRKPYRLVSVTPLPAIR